MCGITGIFRKNESIPQGLIQEMTEKLNHRGPDHQSCETFKNNKIAFGHNRLSIIDLNQSANQPFVSDDKKTKLVFNGEIYNFKRLKSELKENHGVTFKTHSDTEVVLKSFEIWGDEFVEKLNGMFAIAIYHETSNSIYLYRDRIGIKPLYFYYQDNVFAFGSELKALQPLTKHFGKFTLNKSAVSAYFRLGYVPAPHSIFNEVKKLPPGSKLVVNEEGLSQSKYYNLQDQIIKEPYYTNESQAKRALKDKLNTSVKQHLVSDVPFGVFLSGGVDSSTIAAFAAKNLKNEALKTFSISFEEQTHDESKYAQQVANKLKAEHFDYKLKHDDALALIPSINEWYDEPFADSSAIPTFLVAKMASKEVKMVLTGDGGDEQFLGYGMYKWAKRLNSLNYSLTNPLLKNLLKLGGNKFKRASSMFDLDENDDVISHIFSVEQYFFTQNDLASLLINEDFAPWKHEIKNLNRKLSPAEKQAFFDLKYYLPDDLLVKVDRATMMNSLEARVPLLDHNLIEFAINLPEKMKVKKNEWKYLLKSVLYDELPKEIFDRPKWGFSIPLNQWLLKELKSTLEEKLSKQNLEEIPFLNFNRIEQLKKRFFNGENYLYNKLWMIYIFVDWHQKNKEYFEAK